ncbi:MAG: ABC transporter permease [Lachnospiraceae bacterium]|nr:ABC transporter permease [Lachnospiraceae bacterium]
MQSKTSFFNSTIIKRTIKQGWPILVGYIMVLLMEFPVSLAVNLSQWKMWNEWTSESYLEELQTQIKMNVSGSAGGGFMFVIMGIILAIYLFAYLYTARNANMMHAFPVTRKELFLSNVVAGLIMLLVPIVVTGLLGVAIIAANSAELVSYGFIWMYFMAMYALFYFGLAVCVCMFTGNVVAAPVFYSIMLLLYGGIACIVKGIEGSFGYGLSTEIIDLDSPFNPVLYLDGHSGINEVAYSTAEGYFYNYTPIGFDVAASYAVIGIALLVAAYALYRRRRVETAGDWISVGWAKPLFRWGIGFGVGTLGALVFMELISSSREIIFFPIMLVFILVFFVFSQMIIMKDFRVINKKLMIEGIVCSVLFTGFFVFADINGYWREDYIPSVDEIDYAIARGNYGYYFDGENLEKIISVQKDLIVAKDSLEGSKTSDYSINLSYRLKNGKYVRRIYNLNLSNEIAKNIYNEFYDVVSESEYEKKTLFGPGYEDFTVDSMSLNVIDDSMSTKYVSVEQDDYMAIYQAILKDIDEGHISIMQDYDSYMSSESDYANSINIEGRAAEPFINPDNNWYNATKVYTSEVSSYITVNPDCTNVIDTLYDLGYMYSKDAVYRYSDIN